jgi:hypothetical protein
MTGPADPHDGPTELGAGRSIVPGPTPGVPDFRVDLRCLRLFPLSGWYKGMRTDGSEVLDLRVDIASGYERTVVLDQVSGDVYRHYDLNWFGRRRQFDVYRYSWVIDRPTVEIDACSATITGSARKYSTGERFDVTIELGWVFGRRTSSICSFDVRGTRTTFDCTYHSRSFRELELEVDVAASVNAEPIEPDYEITSHSNRPRDVEPRRLTVQESFADAGVDVTINAAAERTIIDDSHAQFASWNPDELHDAMEQHYSRFRGGWPAWKMWFFVCGSYDRASVGGIMFDYSGPAEPPERQGCAIFRNHWWWRQLTSGPPADDREAEAQRKWLHTWVHEIGHGFNYMHSWDKGSPDDLSWMNYDWRYDNRNGANSYFANFRFRFSDTELGHLRHGDRRAVIPGGDAWGTGRHAEQHLGMDETVHGDPPVEVLVRSKPYFEFLEPVKIEVRLRNLTAQDGSRGLPIDVDADLAPEDGTLSFVIRRPDGRTLDYHAPMCRFADTSGARTLHAGPDVVEGEDRYSTEVTLGFGADGFYFDDPGTYLVRAIWTSSFGLSLPSQVHQLRIGRPVSTGHERMAGDLFTRDAGLALYFGGSASPHLAKGMDALQAAIDELHESPHAKAQLAASIAPTFTSQRFRVNEECKVVRARASDPDRALELMDVALEQQADDERTLTPISEHMLHRDRATVMAKEDRKTAAKRDLKKLATKLRKRGVNQPVIDELTTFIDEL